MKEKIDKRFLRFFVIILIITVFNYLFLFDKGTKTEEEKTEKLIKTTAIDTNKTDSLND